MVYCLRKVTITWLNPYNFRHYLCFLLNFFLTIIQQTLSHTAIIIMLIFRTKFQSCCPSLLHRPQYYRRIYEPLSKRNELKGKLYTAKVKSKQNDSLNTYCVENFLSFSTFILSFLSHFISPYTIIVIVDMLFFLVSTYYVSYSLNYSTKYLSKHKTIW